MLFELMIMIPMLLTKTLLFPISEVLRKMLQQEKTKNAQFKFTAISGVDVRPFTPANNNKESDEDKVLEFKKSGEVLDNLEEKLRNPPYSPGRIFSSDLSEGILTSIETGI